MVTMRVDGATQAPGWALDRWVRLLRWLAFAAIVLGLASATAGSS